jgi:hypothetical protein
LPTASNHVSGVSRAVEEATTVAQAAKRASDGLADQARRFATKSISS